MSPNDSKPEPHLHVSVGDSSQATQSALDAETKRNWRQRLRDWLLGYDFFVSYHWASGGAYAVNLAQMLRSKGFDVFLDRADYASGDDWKRMGQIALRNTQRLILVATNEAVFDSKPVEHEVLEFSKRSRHVVPICFGYTLNPEAPSPSGFSDEVWKRIRGTTLGIPQPVVVPKGRRYQRKGEASLPNAPTTDQMLPDKPSERVVNELIRTHKVLRRRNLRALLTLIPSVIVGLFAAFATYQWRDARIAESNAVESRNAESIAKTRATQERDYAVRQQNIAIAQSKRADHAAKEAKTQADFSESRRLAALSEIESERRLDRALLLAVEALGTLETVEARSSLFNALIARPGLNSFLHADEGRVTVVGFSPDGQTLAVGYDKAGRGGVVLWDVAQRARATEKPLVLPAAGVSRSVTNVLFSPNGKILVAAYHGGVITLDSETIAGSRSGVVLWDTATGTCLLDMPLPEPAGYVMSIAFSPDGQTLAAGYWFQDHGGFQRRGGVMMWELIQGAWIIKPPLAVTEGEVVDISFSSDGETLAAGYNLENRNGGGVVLWGVKKCERRFDATLPAPEGCLLSVLLSLNVQTVTAVCPNRVVQWDVNRRQPVFQWPLALGGNEPITTVARSRDGGMLALGGGSTAALWDPTQRMKLGDWRLTEAEGFVNHVAFSYDGQMLAVGFTGRDGGSGVMLWNTAVRTALGQAPLVVAEGLVTSVAYSLDAQCLAAGYSSGDKGGLVLWDAATRDRLVLASRNVPEGAVHCVAFAPNGQTVAAGYGGTDKCGVVLWDLTKRERLEAMSLGRAKGIVNSVAFSPDSQTLVAAYAGGTDDSGVALWDMTKRERVVLKSLSGSNGSVSSVAFSPNGQTVAVGYAESWPNWNNGNAVLLLDVAKQDWIVEPRLAVSEGTTTSVSFSSNGETIAVGYKVGAGSGGGILRWNAAQNERQVEVSLKGTGHSPRVTFGANQMTFAEWYDSGGIVALWDVNKRGKFVARPYKVHEGILTDAAFSPNGQTLAVTYMGPHADSGGVVVLDVDYNSWLCLAKQIANRNLTRAEWHQYFPEIPYRPTFLDLPVPPD